MAVCANGAPQFTYYPQPIVYTHAIPYAAAALPNVAAPAAVKPVASVRAAAPTAGSEVPEVVIQGQVDAADRLEYFNNLLK